MLKIGSHVSFKSPNYLIDSIKTSIENGANVMMIYLGPPQSTIRATIDKYKYDEYLKDYLHIIPPQDIIIHAPYIINLANKEKSKFSCQFLIDEINRMKHIKAKYLVLHPGASVKFKKEDALNQLVSNLKYILDETIDSGVEIILETMAGKGTELGSNFNEISYLVNNINSNRIGLCLDTCHMWDSGYDLKNDFENNNGKMLFNELDKFNLLNKIKVIHLNDSKNELGSKKDRHENIGHGFIGLKALVNFANHEKFKNIPIILETPYININSPYKKEIELIKNKTIKL